MFGPQQQASLRRIAALVAAGAPSAEVFAAISREIGHMLAPRLVQIFRWERDGSVTVVGTWGEEPNPFPAGSSWPWEDASLDGVADELRAGRPVRVEDVAESFAGELADAALSAGIGSAVGAPIIVDGDLWGHVSVVMVKDARLPVGVEARLAEITKLVATAFASSDARERLMRLADEQAALRRVATLVATGAQPTDVFDAVAAEIGGLFDVASSGLVRYEEGEGARIISGWGALDGVVTIGIRLPIGGENVISRIYRTGRPARLHGYASTATGATGATGAIAERVRRGRTESSIGCPIVVAGALWGCLVASTAEGRTLPPDAEPRLVQFTELMGAAIANAEAQGELARLADEQAALRRVATLVAEDAPLPRVLAVIGAGLAGMLGPRTRSAFLRYEEDGKAAVLAGTPAAAGGLVVGERLRLGSTSIAGRVHQEQGPVRVDAYTRSNGDTAERAITHGITAAVGCPILVQGRLWGAMVVVHDEPEPLPADTERRVTQFTDLLATAIANTEARAQLQLLLDEQAALRRVATLVATAAAPPEVFDAVIVEVARLLGGAQVGMVRVESADEVTVVAYRGPDASALEVGMRLPVGGDSATARVLRAGRSARIDFRREGHGAITELARSEHAVTTIGTPITVEGRLWGVITASWPEGRGEPADAEERLVQFAELLGTAIVNAATRDQLEVSRARVLTAGDDARRRVVRDLHDGGQQRLVHAIITIKLARSALGTGNEAARAKLDEALQHAERGNQELRELAHGILPTALLRGGLDAGIDSVVERLDVPVAVDVTKARFAREIEASAYFIVAEALTNVVKHAGATRAQVLVAAADGRLRLAVRDDGVGGADPGGDGLLGVGDRVAALGGRLRIESPRGAGTLLEAELPLPAAVT